MMGKMLTLRYATAVVRDEFDKRWVLPVENASRPRHIPRPIHRDAYQRSHILCVFLSLIKECGVNYCFRSTWWQEYCRCRHPNGCLRRCERSSWSCVLYQSVKLLEVTRSSAYTKVLALPSITYMSALQGFNKLLILHSGNLLAYSLDLVARVGQGHASLEVLDASLERLARNDRHATVSFFRVGVVAGKTLGESAPLETPAAH